MFITRKTFPTDQKEGMRQKITIYQQPFSTLAFTELVCILLALSSSHFKDRKVKAQRACVARGCPCCHGSANPETLSVFALHHDESTHSSRDNGSNGAKRNTGQQSRALRGRVGVLTSQPRTLTALHGELLGDCARRGGGRRG